MDTKYVHRLLRIVVNSNLIFSPSVILHVTTLSIKFQTGQFNGS